MGPSQRLRKESDRAAASPSTEQVCGAYAPIFGGDGACERCARVNLARVALVADAHVTQDANSKRNAHLVICVASPRFNDILSGLRPLGKVKSENISTQDITKEYADLETRTVVKKTTVARLRALLENRTGKLADVLEVERELSRAVTELEQMKGERRYYDRRVAVSSIAVDVYELRQIASGGIPVTETLHRSLGLLVDVASTLNPPPSTLLFLPARQAAY